VNDGRRRPHRIGELVENAADPHRDEDRRKAREVPRDPPLLARHAVRDEQDLRGSHGDPRDDRIVGLGTRIARLGPGDPQLGVALAEAIRGSLRDPVRGAEEIEGRAARAARASTMRRPGARPGSGSPSSREPTTTPVPSGTTRSASAAIRRSAGSVRASMTNSGFAVITKVRWPCTIRSSRIRVAAARSTRSNPVPSTSSRFLTPRR